MTGFVAAADDHRLKFIKLQFMISYLPFALGFGAVIFLIFLPSLGLN